MVVPMHSGKSGVYRASLALDPYDVELLDRLAALSGSNRSEQLRQLLFEIRPVLEATVQAFEAAVAAKGQLSKAAAEAAVTNLTPLLPRAERMQADFLHAIGSINDPQEPSEEPDPRRSNHGGHPTPTPPPSGEAE